MHDENSSSDYFYLLQNLYTVAGLANAAGETVEAYDYDAFGRVRVYQADTVTCDSDTDGDCDLVDFWAFEACYDVATSGCSWSAK